MGESIHLKDDSMCYACGKKNEKGLHLEFTFSEEAKKIETTFLPSTIHQGWKGVVHGGIIITIMDEAMAKLVHFLGYHALTASIDVRFKQTAKIFESLKVSAEITKFSKRLIFTRAVANREDGKVIAVARAKMMVY